MPRFDLEYRRRPVRRAHPRRLSQNDWLAAPFASDESANGALAHPTPAAAAAARSPEVSRTSPPAKTSPAPEKQQQGALLGRRRSVADGQLRVSHLLVDRLRRPAKSRDDAKSRRHPARSHPRRRHEPRLHHGFVGRRLVLGGWQSGPARIQLGNRRSQSRRRKSPAGSSSTTVGAGLVRPAASPQPARLPRPECFCWGRIESGASSPVYKTSDPSLLSSIIVGDLHACSARLVQLRCFRA